MEDIQINAKIFVVDDEEGIREILEELLTDFGASVDLATNGLEGLEKAKANQYDVIFSDVKMPTMTGEEFLSKLKTEDIVPKKFFFVSGGMEQDLEDASLKEVFTGFVYKPFKEDSILELLQEFYQA